MIYKIRKSVASIILFLLTFCQFSLAFADVTLPDGAVAGLPEKLSVLDSDGHSVSSLGEYFFLVEGMQPNVTYTKNIQITNLREDKAYHIYFYAQPLDKKGEIDLENECTADFTLNGEKVFEGKVNGQANSGWKNINDQPIDLGLYKPGDSGKLVCNITWDGSSLQNMIDNGHRLIDETGEHVIREKEGKEYISGEVRFRWIFYAAVDESFTPPDTGVLATGYKLYSIVLGIIVVMIIAMLIINYLADSKKKRGHKIS